jgi:hypothetical protein
LDLSLIPEIGIENYQSSPGSNAASPGVRKQDPQAALGIDTRQVSTDR